MHEKFNYKSLDEVCARAGALGAWLPLWDDLSPLQRPLTVAGHVLPNRLALQPMEGTDGLDDGAPGPYTLRRYQRFAAGGASLIWFEAVATVPEARASAHQLWLTPENLDAYRRMTDAIRETGLRENGFAPLIIMQATHSGRYSKPHGVPEPLIAYNNPCLEGDTPIDPARILDDDALAGYAARFGPAARLAQAAGFDGVDIKCCHRYLACELLSAYERPGRYGGSFENRTRFLREAYQAARADTSGAFLLTSRLNIYDGFPYPYGFGMAREGGLAPDWTEAIALTEMLIAQGAPLLNLTMGNPYKNPHVNRPYDVGGYVPEEHPLTGLSRMMTGVAAIQHAHPDIPMIGSAFSYLRGYSANLAAGMVGEGHAAMAGFGRMAFANPDFPRQLAGEGAIDSARACIACGQCALLLRAGQPAGCVVRDGGTYRPAQ